MFYFLLLLGVCIVIIFFIFTLLFSIPWLGIEEEVVYEVGDSYCVVEYVDHCFFQDREYFRVYDVIEISGSFYYETSSGWQLIEVFD